MREPEENLRHRLEMRKNASMRKKQLTICFISTTASDLEMAASSLSPACLVDMMSRAPAANELEINSAAKGWR
jgi:hypothetical protein